MGFLDSSEHMWAWYLTTSTSDFNNLTAVALLKNLMRNHRFVRSLIHVAHFSNCFWFHVDVYFREISSHNVAIVILLAICHIRLSFKPLACRKKRSHIEVCPIGYCYGDRPNCVKLVKCSTSLPTIRMNAILRYNNRSLHIIVLVQLHEQTSLLWEYWQFGSPSPLDDKYKTPRVWLLSHEIRYAKIDIDFPWLCRRANVWNKFQFAVPYN